MGRRGTQKKRGVARGVAKHKISSKPLKLGNNEKTRTVAGIRHSVFFALGKSCFEFLLFCCHKLHLVPFTRTPSGQYVPLDGKNKVLYLIAWFLMFLMLVHKVWGMVMGFLLYEGLEIETLFCVSLFLIYFVPVCVSLGVIVRPQETIDLLNAWPLILSCLEHDVPSPYDDLSESLKLVAVLAATQAIPFPAVLGSLIFSTLPTCYYPAAKNLDLIPEGTFPNFAWQLIFAPLEYVTYLPPMFPAAFSGSILLITAGVLKIYGQRLR